MARWTFLVLLASCGGQSPRPDPPAREHDEAAPSTDPEARAREALTDSAGGFLSLWSELDAAERERLAISGDINVALAARWEIELEAYDMTTSRLQPESVERIAELVRERVGARPPAWWTAVIAQAVLYPDESAIATFPVGTASMSVFRRRAAAAIETRASLEVSASPRGFALAGVPPACGGECGHALVPASALEVDGHVASHLEAALAPAFAIILAFDAASGGVPYRLRRYEADSTERWSREVCGGGREEAESDGAQLFEIVIAPDGRIVVFGAEQIAIYVDVLAADDGSLLAHWNSELWFHRSY